MQKRRLHWAITTFLILPLVYLMHLILDQGDIPALGIIGVLVLFSFSQFFFLRRSLRYTYLTVLSFYLIGLVGAFLISYTQWVWLILVQIYGFYLCITHTSFFTLSGFKESKKIDQELEEQTWYIKFLATYTQQMQNKKFILDFVFFLTFILMILYFYDFVIAF